MMFVIDNARKIEKKRIKVIRLANDIVKRWAVCGANLLLQEKLINAIS